MSFPIEVALNGEEESLVITEIVLLEASNQGNLELSIDDLYHLVSKTIDVDLKIISE